MPSLQVRNLPEGLYYRLQENAQKELRSLSQQAIMELKKALNIKQDACERRRNIVETVLSRPPLGGTDQLPDPATMVREDMDQR